jgi:N-acetyl-anhydromuramyl-L-alanine amidase AmpD
LQHQHWDNFEATVGSLSAPEQRLVQRSNTESYLAKWHLTVAQLKSQLRLLGVYGGDVNDELTNNVFDAIVQFQRKHNLRHIDGVFGPLNYSEMEKVSRSIVNR